MILCPESIDAKTKTVNKYPMTTARANCYHILIERKGKWVCVEEVRKKTDPNWMQTDWTKYGLTGAGQKPRMWLVEASTGVVRSSKDVQELANIRRPATLEEVRAYHDIMFASLKATVKIDIVQMTQAQFGHLLTNGAMSGNREPLLSRLAFLMSAVFNLDWKLVDSAICLDVHGHVINGGNRLTAESKMGWTGAPVVLITGLPISCSVAMDSGAIRDNKGKLKMDYDIPLGREFVGGINFCLRWIWRVGGGSQRKNTAPEVENWYYFEEEAYAHMAASTGRKLQSPVIGAFGDAATITGDPRVMKMFDEYRDLHHEAPVGSAVWALIRTIPNTHVLTHGDKKDGNTLQQHRYKVTLTAILSYLDGDKKKWSCEDLLNNHKLDRESISFELVRRSKATGRLGSDFVFLPSLVRQQKDPLKQAA